LKIKGKCSFESKARKKKCVPFSLQPFEDQECNSGFHLRRRNGKKISFLEIRKNGIGKINFDFIIEAFEIQLEVQALKKNVFTTENPFYMALSTLQHCWKLKIIAP
jgi:hypothetical protein